ncbi:NmrA family NAD(P)-binding protein [Variovorax sp. IB41]|uniref:NmrA family NAD(P)-binding protein n=1 Tax=Variovorax sp. IB41 TaxID=2779370 RepID=UPI0018E72575|nr:NmrA family NAD(P)-binding protein [Variovorax sp. IB41]MBJ2154423.1 NmrA family NAD(P)-binding protein [Variovorax sp. IB41]
MHIILGATGHVGSSLAQALLARNEPVTVVTRDASKAEPLKTKGAHVAQVDVFDTPALHRVIARGHRLFVLNPPAPPSTDTVAEERRSLYAIVDALEGCKLEKIVCESAYGAQPGNGIGDLGVLYDMEQALQAGKAPVSPLRAAYYMSNWDASLDTARNEGKLHSMYPPDFTLPMVAPHDLGEFAARLMLGAAEASGPHYVEGPERYSPADVARAFADALGRPVEVAVTPPEQWEQAYRSLGFSEAAARSYAAMTRITLDNKEEPEKPERGATSLRDYITALVKKSAG